MTETGNPLDALQKRLGVDWPAINQARSESARVMTRISELLKGQDSEATSVVCYGSLARGEWTVGSDMDWTLLVDGGVDPQHVEAVHRITDLLSDADFAKPGKTGTFGNCSFGHDLVHKIGGQEDSNQNTTRRILLLLESAAIGRAAAYGRVRRHALLRYIEDDRGLRHGTVAFIPRFLLNDIVRYWRTMAVDFAQKQREQQMEGWALRNAKLRMSRKLIFASGLLVCLHCELSEAAQPARQAMRSDGSNAPLVEYLESRFARTPLENVAAAVSLTPSPGLISKPIFENYDRFLAILDDPEKRDHLKKLRPEAFTEDALFTEVRKMSHAFQDGLVQLFFKSGKRLADLTMRYGVF